MGGLTLFIIDECKKCERRFDCPLYFITPEYLDNDISLYGNNALHKDKSAAAVLEFALIRQSNFSTRNGVRPKCTADRNIIVKAFEEDRLWVRE